MSNSVIIYIARYPELNNFADNTEGKQYYKQYLIEQRQDNQPFWLSFLLNGCFFSTVWHC